MFEIDRADALLIIDVQNCFCLGGEIPVPEGDEVVPVLNRYIKKFRHVGAKIFATRDWHPPNHRSFREFGGIWPPHCVQGTEGAKFHPDLNLPKDATVISVGVDPFLEGYSGFENTDLEYRLNQQGIIRVFVGGLATDYCVKHTVLDALEKNFEVILLMDATKGVNKNTSDVQKAIVVMTMNGAKKTTFAYID